MNRSEHDILTACALRFDGYAYQRATGFEIDGILEAFWRTGEWPDDLAQRMATFFFLQRALCKWDLVYEPRDGRYWRAFRSLFFSVCEADPPEPYRDESYATAWDREFKSRLPEIVGIVRDIQTRTESVEAKGETMPHEWTHEVFEALEARIKRFEAMGLGRWETKGARTRLILSPDHPATAKLTDRISTGGLLRAEASSLLLRRPSAQLREAIPAWLEERAQRAPARKGLQFGWSRLGLDGLDALIEAIDAVCADGKREMEEGPAMSTDEIDQINTDANLEESDDDTPLDIPKDRRRVKTEKNDTPVTTINDWINRGKVILQPDFQRNFVWSSSKASLLVESLLLDIPIPVVYLAEEAERKYSVVDGQQRLTSIWSFVNGKFPDDREFKLTKLQVLSELKGMSFRDLSSEMQERILDSSLRVIIIQRDSDPDVKFEVFERLNLGAEKLTDQELRNCIYRGSYNGLLKELVENQRFRKIFGSPRPHDRMLDRQLILRFFAMWRSTHLKYRGPMKQFLNREMEANRNLSERDRSEMRTVFEKSIEMAYTVFGDKAFRRFVVGRDGKPDGAWEKRLNMALWDTILYTFSFFEKNQIVPAADRIREEFLDVMTSDRQFIEYVVSTGDKPDRIQYRADVWRRRLQDVLGAISQGPRTFSLELKEQLYRESPTCQICRQRIHDVDDAEVDHVVHYWRGGQTIPENARLTHRYCNRARGGRE
jgi:hypothetical protein